MNIKDKIKFYEENMKKNKITGYKKTHINNNSVRRKVTQWNNINIDIEKKTEEKNEHKTEEKTEHKKKYNESEDEYELENGIINM